MDRFSRMLQAAQGMGMANAPTGVSSLHVCVTLQETAGCWFH